MKKLFVLFVSLVLCVCSGTKMLSQEKGLKMTHVFQSSSIRNVEVATSGGSIILTGDAGSESKVEVYVSRDNWSDSKIKETIEKNYTIETKVENGKLYAVAKSKNKLMNWNQQGLSISFKISVPKQVNSNLQTSGGSIQIKNLSGSHDFKTSGGSLMVESLSGSIIGRTSGGSITVSDSKDNISLHTSGGSISAKDCSGQIDLRTSGGSLNLNNLNGTINAATSGGSVTANDIQGTLKAGTSGGSMNLNVISGNVDASTSGGSMNVKIKSANEYVKLSNSGNINLILPANKGYNLNIKANKVDASEYRGFNGAFNEKSIEGTMGGGGTEINVKSSQRVHLSFE